MKRTTAEWVRKAEADVLAARNLMTVKPRLNDAICFHCQQAIEKYLKALLQEWGLPIPYIHDLDDLLDLVLPLDATLNPLRPGLNVLTQYAVDYRYPGKTANSRKSTFAIRLTENARKEMRKRLGIRDRRRKSP